MKDIKIKLVHLITLSTWLHQLALDKILTRDRTRFLKTIKDILKGTDYDKKRLELVKKYAKKDKDGEYIMFEDENGRNNYDLSDEDKEKVKIEYDKVLEQELVIPLDGNKSKINAIKEILSTTSFEFQGQYADEYDEWCEVFEIK